MAPLPTVVKTTTQPSSAAQRTAAKRTAAGPQRFWNKGTGRMEALQNGHFPGKPPGHTVVNTQHTVKSETVRQAPKQQPSLIQLTIPQIEDRAKRIVNSETAAERLPFQQRAGLLSREEAGAQQAHTQNYGQLDTSIGDLQGKQAGSAKTFQNTAADMVKRAEQGAPGAAETNEHLGGAPAPGSPLARQQEAARTLLTAIASSAQGGTNTRQQAETDFLANLKGTAQQEAAGGTRQIAGEYGRKKQENANEEARVDTTKPGRVGKLVLGLEGEQEKLRIAAGGLNLKGAEAERHAEETRSQVQNRKAGQRVAVKKQSLAERAQGSKEKHERTDEEYKRASSTNKKLKDSLDIKQKELSIKKALEGHPNKGALTPLQVNEMSGEAAKVFNAFRRARERGDSPAQIREALSRGYFHYSPNKKQEEEKKKPYNEKTGINLKQPIWLDVAEQIMQKEYVDAPTKQRLREMGLPDSEWSNHFLGGPKPKRGRGTHGRA